MTSLVSQQSKMLFELRPLISTAIFLSPLATLEKRNLVMYKEHPVSAAGELFFKFYHSPGLGCESMVEP